MTASSPVDRTSPLVAQQVPDLRGTWIPVEGAHIVDGPTRHQESGTELIPGHDTLRRHTSKFVFLFQRPGRSDLLGRPLIGQGVRKIHRRHIGGWQAPRWTALATLAWATRLAQPRSFPANGLQGGNPTTRLDN